MIFKFPTAYVGKNFVSEFDGNMPENKEFTVWHSLDLILQSIIYVNETHAYGSKIPDSLLMRICIFVGTLKEETKHENVSDLINSHPLLDVLNGKYLLVKAALNSGQKSFEFPE